jgi:DNA-directed RNA polymerase subunit K/omega
MTDRKLSRGPGIDTEECVKQAGGNRFNLVLVAGERLRELRRQNKNNDTKYITAVDALEDVQAGKVDTEEYLDKIRDRQAKEKENISRGY